MPTDIDANIRAYFDWVEQTSGCVLRPGHQDGDSETPSRRNGAELPTAASSGPSGPHRTLRSLMLAAAAAVVVIVAGLIAIGGRTTSPAQTAESVPGGTAQPLATPLVALTPPCPEPVSSTPSPWDGCIDMLVYINGNATAEQIDVVGQALLSATGLLDTSRTTYIDKAAALDEAARVLIDEPEALSLLNEENITTFFKMFALPGITDADLRPFVQLLEDLPGVREAKLRSDPIVVPDLVPDVVASIGTPVETALPPAGPALIAIGDMVMLGAAEELNNSGFAVDATESRGFGDLADILAELRRVGTRPDVVVVSLGTNGPISVADMDQAMVELESVPRVIVMTIKPSAGLRPHDDTATNNDIIRALPDRYPNVEVLDWANAASTCRGDCFYEDGIHLKADGARYFADLVAGAIN